MITHIPALEIAELPGNPCCLPVHNLSSQTRHIVGRQNVELKRAHRMLSAFAVVLSLALATVLCLLVTTSSVNAMQIVYETQTKTADGFVALAALLSLGASAGVGIALVKLQFSAVRKR